jgi:DNA-binding MarR family transcriptional regulator
LQEVPVTREQVGWLEGIIFGGVAITTSALEHAGDGEEISLTQWRAILEIGEREEGCRVGEVANSSHASLPNTSRLLRRLERRGLLSLERDEQDRRATRARLTEAGVRIRSSVLAYRRDEIAAIVDEVKPSASANRALRDLAALFDARGHAQAGEPRGPSDPPAAR